MVLRPVRSGWYLRVNYGCKHNFQVYLIFVVVGPDHCKLPFQSSQTCSCNTHILYITQRVYTIQSLHNWKKKLPVRPRCCASVPSNIVFFFFVVVLSSGFPICGKFRFIYYDKTRRKRNLKKKKNLELVCLADICDEEFAISHINYSSRELAAHILDYTCVIYGVHANV